MAIRYPQEFRDEVVGIARKREATLKQIAKDFGVSEASLKLWIKKADEQDGVTSSSATDDSELRELKKRNRLLEQENEVLRRAAMYLGKDVLPK